MVKVASSDTNPEGGGGITHDCDCHVMIDKVEVSTTSDDGAERTSVKIELLVLASTVPGENNKRHSEFLPLEGKAAGITWNVLVATGMITRDQWKAAKDAGSGLDFDEMQLKGKQFCCGLRMEKYGGKKVEHQGKSFPRMGFRIWGPFDEEAKHIPKDKECLALLGTPPAKAATTTTATAATTASPKPSSNAAPQAASGFNW